MTHQLGIADILPVPRTADQPRKPVQVGHGQWWLRDTHVPNGNKLPPPAPANRHQPQRQPQPDKYLPLKSSPSKSWGICVWVLWGLFFKLEKSLRTTCALTPKTVPQTKAYYWETVKELMLQLSLKVNKVLQVTPLSNVATVFGCNILQQNRTRSQAERR